ncbi:single-stranded DNA-binding protein [Oryzomonas sagensis]|uniref:Single-stranded DNA-binding protein n=1 Tax=Oryzomonas sagensis TaxID=2603857 RepID=A0ABQ6TL55_9BACT|nr:ERF family protein [Oryzomonas sagensis]KAB0668968.1 single-stranded DNA-binding protein [Oryzomonas sagensis]
MDNEITTIPAASITPMDLIVRAQHSNASIDQMQQLFDLQLRYEANEARKAYNDAMANFREKAPAIAKTRTGHNIKYAGLSESIEAIQPLLSQFGLSHQWKTRQDGNLITVECTVTHRMGHSESTSLSSSPDTSGSKNAIQAIGSTVSYLERYTLYAILGLSSRDMDDDGNGAGKKDDAPIITEAQASDLLTLIENVGADVAKFCVYWKIDAVKYLPAAKFASAVKMLEKKRGA